MFRHPITALGGRLGSFLKSSDGKGVAFYGVVFALALVALPDAAWAQDPFAQATSGANQIRQGLAQIGLAVGGIGMVACLMLGFFGKLQWKWVGTGVGVSFALAIIPTAINWLSRLAGGPTGIVQ